MPKYLWHDCTAGEPPVLSMRGTLVAGSLIGIIGTLAMAPAAFVGVGYALTLPHKAANAVQFGVAA
jgi:hypothetical protein